MTDNDSIVIFGAGKIGRSFIGQIFGLAGYSVIFVDIDPEIVNALNQRKSYPVVIRSEKEKLIKVPNVSALHDKDEEGIARAVAEASILAVSVGKNALIHVIPHIARGITDRSRKYPGQPLDMIIAENMRDASGYIRKLMAPLLPDDFPAERLLGLVETSIGKMVPITTESDKRKDPLLVIAEPYNELILDGKAFIGEIPKVKELAPKSNMRAWVDRKAFVHNLGHATAAYYGAYHHPKAKYIYEVLQDQQVYSFTNRVMLQAARILLSHYQEDFTMPELEEHINDLLKRFRNIALGDTIFRVGQDLTRKLGPEDRFMGIIRMAEKRGLNYGSILDAMVYGFLFRGTDEAGDMYPEDVVFLRDLSADLENTLVKVCGLHADTDRSMIEHCKHLLRKLTPDNKPPDVS